METKNRNNIPNFKLSWIYPTIVFILSALFIASFFDSNQEKEIDYTTFKNYVSKGYVTKIYCYDDNRIEAFINKEAVDSVFTEKKQIKSVEDFVIKTNIPSTTSFEDFIKEAESKGEFKGTTEYKQTKGYFQMFFFQILFPIILFIGIWMFISRRMMGGGGNSASGIFSVGKSKAQLFDKGTKNKVTFKDVAGLEGAKQEIEEIVEFLKSPEKYTELGGKIPKGALLVGPPGTGKTLLAKAVAGEADVPFFSLSGSDFVEMFVGVGASRVRDLFKQAKEKSPCIVFIDEIDAVGRARGRNNSMGGNDERENTLNQLLTEMDGFSTNSGIILLAATNRVDVLDKALLRAGRFDRQIHVDLPDLNERKAVFGVHLRPIKIDDSVDVDLLAKQTAGFSGADIANVCNEAALIAARHRKDFVGKQDFLDAVDRIVGGLEKKNKITTEKERHTIAVHESGHATISWLLEHANPLVKVTIVPRGRALGAAWYLPEERQITTKEQMLDEMCAILGGRAAEDVFLGKISSGAMNDLERVTKQAYAMVAYLGMSDQIPNICYYGNEEYSFNKPYSEKTAEQIDIEVRKLIAEQYERAKKILSEHKEGHAKMVELLMEKEMILTDDVERILGKRQWLSRSEELILATEKSNKEKEAKQAESSEECDNSEKPSVEAETKSGL